MATKQSNWTLRKKLIIAFLSAGLLPLIVGGIIANHQASTALETAAFNQLESMREIKRRNIEDYFQSIHDQVLTLSENPNTVIAMNTLKMGFHNDKGLKKLEPGALESAHGDLKRYYETQYGAEYQNQNGKAIDTSALMPREDIEVYRQFRYIAQNPNPLGEKHKLDHAPLKGEQYDRVHREFHPAFRSFLEKFGYYDIFLIDPDTGHIIYSVFKELDYGTSLLTGPYKDTNFARAFRRARDAGIKDAVILEDFEPYSPSYEAAASFISSPIYDKNRLAGVLIFQMPVGRINEIMTSNAGLGETGETYLLGGDHLMRSQSRFSDDNTIGKLKIDSVAVDEVLAGKTDQKIITDYRDVMVLSSYTPVEVEGLQWGLIAEIDKDEAFAAEIELQITMIIMTIVAVLVVLVISFLLIRNVLRQLGGDPSEIQKVAEAIADNDLNIELKAPDQSSGVYASMSQMRDNLRDSIERDRKLAAESSRIKQALDNSSTNVMVADVDNNIIYINDALIAMFSEIEDEIRQDLPCFNVEELIGSNIDKFHKNPAHQVNILNKLGTTHEAEFVVGGNTMSFAANPIIDDNGQRLGTVVEWANRTAEVAIQKDIGLLIDAAQNGDLSQRLDENGKQGFFLILSKGMNQLLETTSEVFEQLAQVMGGLSEGDLKQKMSGDHSGTFENVQNNVNITIESLREIVASIRSSTDLIATGSDEIATGNNSLSSRTEQQAASLEKTASAMEELTSTVRQNADNAQQANQLADNARQTAQSGGEVVGNAVTAMQEINQASNRIAEIIGVIDDIAFQTNLLALNASVEAARAGDQGRGFAVVATEVRNLAQRSATAAKEIKDLIQDSVEKVNVGANLVNESGESLENIVTSVIKVGDIVAEIATASQEQASGIDQVNHTISNLDELTQQNAALAEETSAASVSMDQRAREMASLVDFFKVDNQAPIMKVVETAAAPTLPTPEPKAAKKEKKVSAVKEPKIAAANQSTPLDNNDDWEEF